MKGMDRQALAAEYLRVRRSTARLCAPLETEDYVVQPVDDVSPPKWHLGHTTWFFEQFLLLPFEPGFAPHDERYPGVFNSYYRTVGDPFPRARRGTLSRPTVAEVYAYRDGVDERLVRLMAELPEASWDAFSRAVALGLNHEQQHQELLVADIKLILAHNAVAARYDAGGAGYAHPEPVRPPRPARFVPFEGGRLALGHDGEGFAFDNEAPVHDVLLPSFALCDRLVTNGEFLEFVRAGGYSDFRHWLSDGWDRVRLEGWRRPLFWTEDGGLATPHGEEDLDPDEPVCHLSYYEADAFARWAGKRLPTEAEWELASRTVPVEGRFMEDGCWRPRPAGDGPGLRQVFGDAWEWTSSAYAPYPGFKPLSGAFGEYNGKFMSGQLVLRGGSCATPRGHVRPTYRNFFQPEKRWQFVSLRLAEDP